MMIFSKKKKKKTNIKNISYAVNKLTLQWPEAREVTNFIYIRSIPENTQHCCKLISQKNVPVEKVAST